MHFRSFKQIDGFLDVANPVLKADL